MGSLLRKLKRHVLWKLSSFRYPKSKTHLVQTRINGYDLLVFANEDVGRSIHFIGSYETPETIYLARSIPTNSICVDVGANIGYFTMLMAKCAGGGMVHAFEPLPLNAALLRASIELNGLTNIVVNQSALGNSIGDVSFSESSDSAFSSICDTQRRPLVRTLTVPVTTLDEYVGRQDIGRVDVLKVDVEGAEGLVVDGGSKLLSDAARRPRAILMELQDQNLQVFGIGVNTVLEQMRRFRYAPFVVREEGQLIPFREDMKPSYCNVLFLPL